MNKRGYDFVENKKELEQSRAKNLGSFADRDLAYDMDRPQTKAEQPKLSQMTNKAITTLSKDKDGFFLFVEGSKTDWAAHANDPVGMISDVLAFDEAVGKAVEFAKKMEIRWLLRLLITETAVFQSVMQIQQKDMIPHLFLLILIH